MWVEDLDGTLTGRVDRPGEGDRGRNSILVPYVPGPPRPLSRDD